MFSCDQCSYSTRWKGTLVVHQRTHSGDRPYKCTECDAAFKTTSQLVLHTRIHTGEKPYKCKQCDAAFTQCAQLVVHTRIHTGTRPYKCTEFDAAFTQKHSLLKHQRTHTPEYAAKRKRQEERVRKVLSDAGYHFKSEHHIDFKCSGAGTFARIDALMQYNGGVVMLEVDEDQHKFGDYSVGCDMKRMANVMETLALSGNTLPVYWIRYNPGAYTLDGTRCKRSRASREQMLLEALSSVDFSKPFWVHYMFYDCDGGQLAIHAQPEYNQQIKSCCSFVM